MEEELPDIKRDPVENLVSRGLAPDRTCFSVIGLQITLTQILLLTEHSWPQNVSGDHMYSFVYMIS